MNALHKTWRTTLERYDVEIESAPRDRRRYWWSMFDGENPTAVDIGYARWRWTLHVAVFAAFVRRWRRDRRAEGGTS